VRGYCSNSKLHTVHTAYCVRGYCSNSKLHTVHTVYCVRGYCSNSKLHTVHTVYDPAPHNHSQHYQYRTPYAAVHGLLLMMMGLMMPETRCDRSL